MFDLLTYEKGCGVLRMLEQHIGPDVFRDGVRTYLKAHAYGNTVTTRPVGRARGRQRRAGARRHGHLHPPGWAPARLAARRHAQPAALRARAGARRRDVVHRVGVARARRGAGAARPADAPGAPVRHLVLDAEPEPIAEAGQGLAVVNAGGWGMFRVGYETGHRLALAEHLAELTPLERANLLADTWATTLAGHSTLEEFLVLASRLGRRARPGAVGPGRRRARA